MHRKPTAYATKDAQANSLCYVLHAQETNGLLCYVLRVVLVRPDMRRKSSLGNQPY